MMPFSPKAIRNSDDDNNLALENSMFGALRIYIRRLMIFFCVVVANFVLLGALIVASRYFLALPLALGSVLTILACVIYFARRFSLFSHKAEIVLIKDRKYEGKFVALRSPADTTVIAFGDDPSEVSGFAIIEGGVKEPVIFFVPEGDVTYVYRLSKCKL